MLKVITAPEEIITVDEAAEFMRIDAPGDEQDTILAMITASRQWCEEYLRRAIGIQTLELTLPCFPKKILLRPPFIELISVKYIDTNGDEQELTEDDYILSSNSEPAALTAQGCWPSVQEADDSVTIRFRTGYQAGGSPFESLEVPSTIKTAILMQTADLYCNRESQVEKPLNVNPTLERLLSTLRLEMGQ